MRARYAKVQAFLASLAEKNPDLPFESGLLPELFASTAADSAKSTDHIGKLIEHSQGLASRVLRLANSAYYGMQTKVSTLDHAVRLLGLNEVRAIILQLGAASAVAGLPMPKNFPYKELWEHQLFTACIARGIARSVSFIGKDISPDDLYAAGLLHDMGKTMLAAYCPEDWTAISELAVSESIHFYQAEQAYWGLDHAVIGARLLTFWGIPATLTELVNWHHAPSQAQPEYQAAARMLAVANILANMIGDSATLEEIALPAPLIETLLQEADPAKLRESIAASCNIEQVRSMAKTFMEQ